MGHWLLQYQAVSNANIFLNTLYYKYEGREEREREREAREREARESPRGDMFYYSDPINEYYETSMNMSIIKNSNQKV